MKKWVRTGVVARRLDVDPKKLRDWCYRRGLMDKGLVRKGKKTGFLWDYDGVCEWFESLTRDGFGEIVWQPRKSRGHKRAVFDNALAKQFVCRKQ